MKANLVITGRPELTRELVRNLLTGDQLWIARELNNPYDRNACIAGRGHDELGYIDRLAASQIAPQLDAGHRFYARVHSAIGATNQPWLLEILPEDGVPEDPREYEK